MRPSLHRLVMASVLVGAALSGSPALGQIFQATGPRVWPVPNLTPGIANVVVTNFPPGTVTITGTWAGMCGPVTSVDIHSATPVLGVATSQCSIGPLVFTVPFVNAVPPVTGSFAGVFIPAPADLALLLSCDLYLDIHTACGDEIRGQIENGWRYCNLCDGALAFCPCANPGLDETGCENAQGTGGVRLKAPVFTPTGGGAGTATFEGTGFPPLAGTPVIMIRSRAPALVVFGDGLRCIGLLGLVRLSPSISAFGSVSMMYSHGAGPGDFYYQLWYRNTPILYCDPAAGYGLSNALMLRW